MVPSGEDGTRVANACEHEDRHPAAIKGNGHPLHFPQPPAKKSKYGDYPIQAYRNGAEVHLRERLVLAVADS